jgi:hypothetical protein
MKSTTARINTVLGFAYLCLFASAVVAGGASNYPELPTPDPATAKARAQVKAELREAVRLGLVSAGEGDAPQATEEQERLIALAGRRAMLEQVARK